MSLHIAAVILGKGILIEKKQNIKEVGLLSMSI